MIGFWVSIGGGLGALARFAIGAPLAQLAFASFPWVTFLVNVLGSTALGFLHRALPAATVSSSTRAFFTVGLCGGFTTFSAFDLETLLLLQRGQYSIAAAYSLGSVAACVGGVLGGSWLAGAIQRLQRKSSAA